MTLGRGSYAISTTRSTMHDEEGVEHLVVRIGNSWWRLCALWSATAEARGTRSGTPTCLWCVAIQADASGPAW